MSPSSTGMDFLSFSPSLLDILSLLCLRDVIVCKGVSRRFYDVIGGNSKSLPQQSINFHIHTKRKENSEEIVYVYVRVEYKKYWPIIFEASITEKRIRLMQCALMSMNDHYTTKRARMSSKGTIPVDYPDEEIDQFVMDKRRVSVDVPIVSIREELRFVMRSLLSHFSINRLDLDCYCQPKPQWNTPDELRDVVVDTLQERRFPRKPSDQSALVYVARAWPRLDELCQLVDARRLTVFANGFPFEGQLYNMLGWRHEVQINCEHYGRSNVLPFIRAWAEGSCRIQTLWLYAWGDYDKVPLDQMVEMLRQGLPRSQISVVPARAPGDNAEMEDCYAQIFISRPADDLVFHMAYFVACYPYIWMYDDVPKNGKPLQFDEDRIDFDDE